MSSFKDTVQASGQLSDAEKYYWGYMYGLATEYIIPFFGRKNIPVKDAAIIEIGCAEGGNLCAFHQQGAKELVGTDIAEVRLDSARKIAGILDVPAVYSSHDVIFQDPAPEWLNHFDVALLRDVIEHLDDTTAALKNIRRMLKPGGYLYITFPPYYSPYGGHQQTLVNGASKIPFVHLLPKGLFEKAIASGRAADKVEVRRLRNIRMTTSKLRAAAKAAGYSIADERLYLLRPVFKMKFGLYPVSANFLKPFPGLRDVMALEAGYLLRNEGVGE